MKAFKTDEKQQERIEAFFKEETTFFPNHVMLKFMAGFLVAVSSLLNIIPILEYDDGDIRVSFIGCMLFVMGINFYASKYANFTEPLTKKVMSMAELTKYLPVNRMQLIIFRIKKILKPCVITTIIVIAFRLLISFGTHGTATVWDVLMPLGLMVVWPIVIELTRFV